MERSTNFVVMVTPMKLRMAMKVNSADKKTPMNAQYTISIGESPKTTAPRPKLGSTCSSLLLLELYSGGPRLSTSRPSLSLVLVGIFPRAMSSALCDMTGSIPMLATATTVSPFV